MINMNKMAILIIIVLIIILLLLDLFFIRLISPREIDDISPEIPCSEEYLKKADILWVIPKFNNKSISENKEWCNSIKALNKTLGLHGVTHKHNEFSSDKSQEYLQEAIDIFKECFGKKPTMFKPPQLRISKNNRQLIKNNNMKLVILRNQIFHKVYHCNDTGTFSNKFMDLF